MKTNTPQMRTSTIVAPVAADVRRLKLNSCRPQHCLKLGLQFAIYLALTASPASRLAANPERQAAATTGPTPSSQSIPWSDLGTKATAQYSGDGLVVCAGENGAVRLRCAFQRLAGEVTGEGLWLTSTVEGVAPDRFRVVADCVGRDGGTMVELPERGVPVGEAGLAPRNTFHGCPEVVSAKKAKSTVSEPSTLN